MKRAFGCIAAALALTACGNGEEDGVVDVIHGEEVADRFRALENVDSAETRAWAAERNRAAEAFVEADGAGFDAVAERILALSQYETRRGYVEAGGRAFFAVGSSGSPRIDSLRVAEDGEERALVTPDADVRVGGPFPSPDGRRMAYARLPEHDNVGELGIVEVASGETVGEALPGYLRGSSSVAWRPDAEALVYTRYDAADAESPMAEVVLVDLGTGDSRIVYSLSRADIDYSVQSRFVRGGEALVHQVRAGSAQEVRLLFQPLDADEPSVLAEGGEATRIVLGEADGELIFYTEAGAPNGRIAAMNLDDPGRVRTVVAERADQSINATSLVGGNALGLFGDHVVAAYQAGGRTLIRSFDLDGDLAYEQAIPATGAIWGGFAGQPDDPVFNYRFLGLAEPASVYAMDARTGARELVHAPDMNFEPDRYVARRVFVERPDGARVPLLLAHRSDLDPDAAHPTYLYGYGAFGWVSFLWYQPHVVEWMDRGGVFAVAGVRGGGEFGRAWHEAGRGANRQTAIDDYVAASRWMIEEGLTSSDLLVANGGSLSGALAAAAVVQNPDLYGAMVLDFPMIDVLRFQHFGRARAWTGEIGDISNPEVFAALRAYSPYHNVEDGACYPPSLIRVGEHDPTVTPAHGYKFAAALETAQGCDAPILLDVMENAGHDYGETAADAARSHALAIRFLERVLPHDADR